jgi:hypothetical protein
MVGRSRKNIPVSKVVPVIILNYRKKYYSLPQTLSTADERCESNAARAKKQAQSYCPFMFTVFVEICRSTTELLQENLPEIDKARGPVFHLLLKCPTNSLSIECCFSYCFLGTVKAALL